MKSITKVKQSSIEEKWYLVDATNMRIGILASKVAEILQHKNDPYYRENLKPMAKVVIINAEKLDIPIKRGISKFYKNFSGYPGGLRFTSLEDMMKKDPTNPIQRAIKGMLPKTKRADEMMANLYIYKGATHKHESNSPEKINILEIKL